MTLVLGQGSGPGAMKAAQFVVMSASAALPNERVLTGSLNEIVVTDGGAGAAVTLTAGTLIVQTDQANTFTVGGQIIQTDPDTLTAFQIFDADGGAPVLSVDTINERVGIGIAAPTTILHVEQGADKKGIDLYGYDDVNTDYIKFWVDKFGQSFMDVSSIGFFTFQGTPVWELRDARVTFRDDVKLVLGTSSDFAFKYDSATDQTQLLGGPNAVVGIGSITDNDTTGFYSFGTAVAAGAVVQVNANEATNIGQIIKAAAAQTANLTEWQDSAGGVLGYRDASGDVFTNRVYLSENAAPGGTYQTWLQERPSAANRRLMIYGDADGNDLFGYIMSPTDLTKKDLSIGVWYSDIDGGSGITNRFQLVGYGLTDSGNLAVETVIGDGDDGDILFRPQQTTVLRASVSTQGVLIQPPATTVKGLVVKALAAQTETVLEIQNNSGNTVVDFGNALASSEIVFNQSSHDIDFRVESDARPFMFLVDAGVNSVMVGTNADLSATFAVVVAGATPADIAILARGAAAQTGSLLQLQDSAAGVVVDSGDGLASSEWVHNEGGIDIDFRVESLNEDHLLTVDAGADVVRLGDWDTNYTNFAVNGAQTMVGTARVIREMAFPLAGIGRGATAPTLTRLDNTVGYAFTIGDDGYVSFEIPLDWDTTTDIEVSIHVYVDEDYDITSGEMRWQGLWSAVPEDGAEPVDGATHTGTLDSGDVNISTTAKSLIEVELGDIAAASLALHDSVFIKLSRIAIVGGVEVSAEPVVVHGEYEFTSNKLGELM